MLNRYRVEIADAIRPAFVAIADSVVRGSHLGFHSLAIRGVASQVEQIINRMRRNIYAMTVASSGELFARLKEKPTMITHARALEHQAKKLSTGGSVSDRVVYYLNQIDRRLVSLAELAKLKEQPLTFEEIQSAFPKLQRTARAPFRRLAEAKHAVAKPKPQMTTNTVTEPEWADVLSDYQDKYIPVNRGPDAIDPDQILTADPNQWLSNYHDATYNWELESDVTNDFVETVRAGENDAAEQNGISDFVVVSVIDNKTCQNCCGDYGCEDFDGKLVSEVSAMTKGAQKSPPYHFNCRCSSEPAGDDMPDQPLSNAGSFQDWLTA